MNLLSLLAMIMIVSVVSTKSVDRGDEIINAVKAANTTWKAGSCHPSLKASNLKNLFGFVQNPNYRTQVTNNVDRYYNAAFNVPRLPKNFDAREKWPYCPSLRELQDQGPCGSCWAVSTTSAFTDRLCIESRGGFTGRLSAQQLLTCCRDCCYTRRCEGCGGGDPYVAWRYFKTEGIVSGGDYGSGQGCQPYTIPPCHQQYANTSISQADCSNYFRTPRCRKICTNEYYSKRVEEDIHKVAEIFYYDFKKTRPFNMKTDLFCYGPMTATFLVYEDFLCYKSGVYQHVFGKRLFGHAVKVIGWGTENGTKYWLAVNSWGPNWGDNGFFKLRRGTNESGFETEFHGGYVSTRHRVTVDP